MSRIPAHDMADELDKICYGKRMWHAVPPAKEGDMIIGIDPSLDWFVARTGSASGARPMPISCGRASRCTCRCAGASATTSAPDVSARLTPLLPRYLFVGLPPAQLELGFSKVTAIDGVDHFIPTPPFAPLRIPHCEMEAIFSAEIDMQFDQTRAAKNAVVKSWTGIPEGGPRPGKTRSPAIRLSRRSARRQPQGRGVRGYPDRPRGVQAERYHACGDASGLKQFRFV